MKHYIFMLCVAVLFNVDAQTANCNDANSYLVNAYSHVKSSYKSNNISHLKYYANRSVEAFKLAKKDLVDCGCKKALENANKAIDLLVKVENQDTFEDGRFFVKRAKAIAQQSVIEIDKCSIATYNYEDQEVIADNNQLNDLQKEQLKLKQQQEALKRKEAEIKAKLAQQQEKESELKKKSLINSFEKTIANNLKTYNETLNVCGCSQTIKPNTVSENLTQQTIDAINSFYKNELKALATKYLEQLDLCDG